MHGFHRQGYEQGVAAGLVEQLDRQAGALMKQTFDALLQPAGGRRGGRGGGKRRGRRRGLRRLRNGGSAQNQKSALK